MINISIYKVGYVDGNAKKLCRILNSGGNYFNFIYEANIQNIGKPDLFGYAYSDKKFVKILENYKSSAQISIIFTSVPIEENYITRNIGFNIIICTLHQMQEIIKESKKTIEECAAIGILEEIASIEFQKCSNKNWTELFHEDPRGCLFDFAGIKEQTLAKLKTLKICSICEGKLNNYNIHNDIIKYLKRTLEKIKKPTFKKAIQSCINTPIISFIYGGVVIGLFVNILTSIIFNVSSLSLIQISIISILIALIPLLPLIVYVIMWIKVLRDDM